MYKYIIISVLIVIVLIIINTTLFKGKYGEYKINRFLKKIINKDDYLLKNLILSIDNESAQIDHLILSKKGIFVIETKNYSGTIYGDDNKQEWVQSFNYGKQTYKFYSPYKQNLGHIKFLKRIVKKEVLMYNVVIFFNNSIDNIDSKSVYTKKTFKKYYTSIKDIYDKELIDNIYKEILAFNNLISEKEHISNTIKKKDDYNQKIDNLICPSCGARLVIRESKYGKFYGCSNYPKCKFTKDME